MKLNPLWEYSLSVYAKPSVAALCLRLQDEWGADVNMLLCACWLGSIGRSLGGAELLRLNTMSLQWQTECMRPLRAVRRFLKTQPCTPRLYEQTKELELDAERWQQDYLYGELADGIESHGDSFLIIENLSNYCGTLNGTEAKESLLILKELCVSLAQAV